MLRVFRAELRRFSLEDKSTWDGTTALILAAGRGNVETLGAVPTGAGGVGSGETAELLRRMVSNWCPTLELMFMKFL